MVREALFDILAGRIEGARFLDACAGTGAVGIEALSRGARAALFLERDRQALRLIAENLRAGPWPGAAEVVEGDVERSLQLLARRSQTFDVVFLDPPYDHGALPRLVERAAAAVAPGGALVVQHRTAVRVEAPEGAGLRLRRTYRYGDTSLTLLLRPDPVPGA
jgi:16S rRNA (guanine(966)-N(2))-methyltransferase RsmD